MRLDWQHSALRPSRAVDTRWHDPTMLKKLGKIDGVVEIFAVTYHPPGNSQVVNILKRILEILVKLAWFQLGGMRHCDEMLQLRTDQFYMSQFPP
jgi:predicted CoA-binding protein